MIERKPCPFCGCADAVSLGHVKAGNFTAVMCGRCAANGPYRVGEDEADAAWNERPSPPARQPQPAPTQRPNPMGKTPGLYAPDEATCCRWHASGGSLLASCSDGAARPFTPRAG